MIPHEQSKTPLREHLISLFRGANGRDGISGRGDVLKAIRFLSITDGIYDADMFSYKEIVTPYNFNYIFAFNPKGARIEENVSRDVINAFCANANLQDFWTNISAEYDIINAGSEK